MSRLLILLTLPARLPGLRAAVAPRGAALLAALEDVERAELSVVHAASRRSPRNWDRLVELKLTAGTEGRGWVDRGACGDWLADLRSLGLAPAVLLVDAETASRPEPGP